MAAHCPAARLIAAYLVASLLLLPQSLPGLLHLALEVAVLSAAGLLFYLRLRNFTLPARAAVLRRLERDNALAHRPLAGMEDGMAGGHFGGGQGSGQAGAQAQRLWQLHQDRLRQGLGVVKAPLPHPGLARLDHFGLRGALALALVIGLVFAGGTWNARLASGLWPKVSLAGEVTALRLDAWIAPPAYTGLSTIFLTQDRPSAAPIVVPAGSEIFAQIYEAGETPRLIGGDDAQDFVEERSGLHSFQGPLPQGDEIAIEVGGRELAAWPIQIATDMTPQVALTAPPSEGARHALQLSYRALDDYGVVRIAAELRRATDPNAPAVLYDLQLSGLGGTEIEGSDYHDLTAHPWAGLAVDLRLVAEDALGQIGISEPQQLVLPERIFTHPVARAIVALRRELILDITKRLQVAQGLADLSSRGATYDYDTVVALSLVTAERRLLHDVTDQGVADVIALMWRTALRLEDGDLAFAEAQLRDAQEAVMEALLRGAEAAELQALIDALQQAMDEFLNAMIEQALRESENGSPGEGQPGGGEEISRDDLQNLLDQARQLAEAGDLQGAQDLLSQLQEILENMRAETREAEEGDFAADEIIHRMEDLMQRQQELLDRSFDRSGEGGEQRLQESDRRSENQMDAEAQEALRRRLGELMRDLSDMMGEFPEQLGDAEQSMRGARDALGNEQPEEAIGPQGRAMEQLESGYQSTLRSFMEQYGRLAGQGQGDTGLQSDLGRDPLGRETGGFGQDQGLDVQIPSAGDLERARLLLDELRRRRNEPGRTPEELRYIDRLLNQF